MTITEIIQQARDLTGSKQDRAISERFPPNEAIIPELNLEITALCKQFGSAASGLKEFSLALVANKQTYTISTDIGTDVSEIIDVLRSDAYVDQVAPPAAGNFDPVTGQPRNGIPGGVIYPGYQGDVTEVIVNTMRARANAQCSWEVFGDTLRLYPLPQTSGWLVIRYVTTTATLDSLPPNVQAVLVFRACVAILDAMLNRMMSQHLPGPSGSNPNGAQDQLARMKLLQAQRDRYQDRFDQQKGILLTQV